MNPGKNACKNDNHNGDKMVSRTPSCMNEIAPKWSGSLKTALILSICITLTVIGLRLFISFQGEESTIVKSILPGSDWFYSSYVRKAHWGWSSEGNIFTVGNLIFGILIAAGTTAACALVGIFPFGKSEARIRIITVLCGILIVFTILGFKFLVAFESEVSAWPRHLGMVWFPENDVRISWWRWPQIHLFGSQSKWLILRFSEIADIIAGIAVGIAATVTIGMLGFKQWPRRRFIKYGTVLGLIFAVLIFSYHKCNIDPFGVWRSRSNAFEHIFGRAFSKDEIGDIKTAAERAPEYYAFGEANHIVGEKYKNVPADQTPSLRKKQREMQTIKESIIAKLSPEKRKSIVREEYNRLLDKKRGGYFAPETSWANMKNYLDALLETVAIAIWASLLAVICAVPFSILAANNTLKIITPGDAWHHRALRWFGVFVVRRFLDSCRGFNELVMALIFVSVIGLGPFAGILALWIHTTGILGKVFSEAIESIDAGQVEALVGTGANPAQAISFSVIPQVMPTVISYSLLRFESNVRSAAILGWVGAGGIGFLLQDKMNGYNYREVCTMMIMIILTVCMIDYVCGKLRKRFI